MADSTAANEGDLSPELKDSCLNLPFYRSVDWWTFGVASLVVFSVYLLTLSPDVTLAESGQLATASMWAAVPNPPGHPFWTLLTWLFIKLFPFSNIAYRVALTSAATSALACGLVAMMVSRGSNLVIGGMAGLKNIQERRLNIICAAAGMAAATLLGFTEAVWSQAVIVQTYGLSLLLLAGTLSLTLRWIYAPNQRRCVYLMAYLFGLTITSHQLMLAAMGLEAAIVAGDSKLGRDLMGFNCLCWLGGLCLQCYHIIPMFDSAMPMMFVIFNGVGVLSLVVLAVLIFKTKRLFTEWKSVLIMVGFWFAGAGFYFYPALASMTNPPMNWGYPRTVEGFWHVLSRGQYDKINPTDFIHDPKRMFDEIRLYFSCASEEFVFVPLLVALVPFVFFLKMGKRERAWMIGLTGIFLCLSFLVTDLLSPTCDRQTFSLAKIFFAPSYIPIAIWVGGGFALIGAWYDGLGRPRPT